MQNNENTDEWEWINWIEEAIDKYYEYENFKNIQEIGSGAFGKVFRVNWKNFENYLALKSFFNLNNVTVKEIVNEVILIKILIHIFLNIYNVSVLILIRSGYCKCSLIGVKFNEIWQLRIRILISKILNIV